jgi:hypothetical protein
MKNLDQIILCEVVGRLRVLVLRVLGLRLEKNWNWERAVTDGMTESETGIETVTVAAAVEGEDVVGAGLFEAGIETLNGVGSCMSHV